MIPTIPLFSSSCLTVQSAGATGYFTSFSTFEPTLNAPFFTDGSFLIVVSFNVALFEDSALSN